MKKEEAIVVKGIDKKDETAEYCLEEISAISLWQQIQGI